MMATMEKTIKCGACKGRHGSIAEVRECSMRPAAPVAAPTVSPFADPTPPVRQQSEREPLTAGIYRGRDGSIYKVQEAVHGSGHLYAKVLDVETGKFGYAPGAIRVLTPAMRMTLEQAKEFGAIYGVCCNCGATLTDERSISAGIGPVCVKRFQ